MESSFIVEMFKTIDARDWAALEGFFTPDVTYERPGYDPIVGRDALLHFYREVRIIACGNHSLEHIVVDGSYGACWGSFAGKHRNGSDLGVVRFADVYTFEDGRIKTRASYFFQPAV